MSEDPILSEMELLAITGYSTPLRQLDVLHQRGFIRAYRGRTGKVVLERQHYNAVCRGEFGKAIQPQSKVNVSFMKQAA